MAKVLRAILDMAGNAIQNVGDLTVTGKLKVGSGNVTNPGDIGCDWIESKYGAAMGGSEIYGVGSPTQPDSAATRAFAESLATPPGTIAMFGSATAPTGWLLCNGQATTGYTALAAVVGPNVPDLRDRFIVGAGSTYAQGATGGAATVKLTSAESGLPSHTHTATETAANIDHTHSVGGQTVTSAAETADHTHTLNPSAVTSGTISANHTHSGTTASGGPTHTHDDTVDEGITTGDSNDWVDSADDDTTGVILRTNIVRAANTAIGHTHTVTTGNVSANHTHSVDLPSMTTTGRSAAHTHSVTIAAVTSGAMSANASHSHTITVAAVTAADAASAHENRPPYYALTYIIKF